MKKDELEAGSTPVHILYTNWRGETAVRNIIPSRIWWGKTEWHPEEQWLITALDVDKNQTRDFAWKDMVLIDANNGWRPIETAPKNDGSILGYVEGDDGRPFIFVCNWMHLPTMFSSIWHEEWDRLRPENAHDGEWGPDWMWVSGLSQIKQPTHWMPLPLPPKENKK